MLSVLAELCIQLLPSKLRLLNLFNVARARFSDDELRDDTMSAEILRAIYLSYFIK
jgi:hypothetical protein